MNTTDQSKWAWTRRAFLQVSLVGTLFLSDRLLGPQPVQARELPEGRLTLVNVWTNERLDVTYLRKAKSTQAAIVCLCNFTPVPRHGYHIGVPEPGWYRELINTDGITYGGSNMGNGGGVHAIEASSHGFPYSLTLTLPPLSVLMLKRLG